MPPQLPRFDVAIAGGGPVGCALATAIAQSLGDEVTIAVVDRGEAPASQAADVRAYALSAASRHLLEAIGVWQQVAADAQPVTRIEITDSPLAAGLRPVLLTYDNTLDGEPASFIVPSATLTRALAAAAGRAPGVHLVRGAATGMSVSATDARIALDDGGTLVAGLAVAADGRRSRLREAAGIKVVGWSYDQIGIVTKVRHERPHEGCAVQHFLPGGPFAILPLVPADGHDRSCITWSEEARCARQILAMPDPEFLAEVDQRFGGRLGRLVLEGPRQSWPLEMHLAREYVAPRLALIGDAAHGVHPIAGQGLNLAFRDVAALTECIADTMAVGLDAGDVTALARYQRWRRFDSAVSTAAFDGLNRLFSRDGTLLRSVREFGLGAVNRIPALKQLLVSEAAGVAGDTPKLLRGELPG